MRTAIEVLQPRYVLIENVKGLLSAKAVRGVESAENDLGGDVDRPVLRAIGAVCGDLADLRYNTVWTCIRASDVGAAHRRARVFILAYPTDTESRGLERVDDSAVSTPACSGRERVATGSTWSAAGVVDALLPTPSAAEHTGGGVHPDRREGHSRQLIDFALIHGTPRWGDYEPAIRRQEQLSRPAPSPTEPNTKGRPRLSAAFAEWLMYWPEGWVTDPVLGLTRVAQLKIIGNGVVGPQAVAAFEYLLNLEKQL